ncbi:hypothetical protein JHK86_001425 [Glycine max]|nr:hypothetical protein JHK86_001425 [Glycine max]
MATNPGNHAPSNGCSNVNFAFRGACNRCGTARPAGASGISGAGGRGKGCAAQESGGIGRPAGGGLFGPNDWPCPMCGNINWAKRTKCNICNTNKPGHNEGGVRHVAVVSLLLSSLVPKLVDPAVDPDAYRNVVSTVTLFAGIFQAAFGIFRLGFLVDFLSHAALVGFMAGATIMIGFSFRSVHQETLITNNYVMRIGAATPRKSSSHQQGEASAAPSSGCELKAKRIRTNDANNLQKKVNNTKTWNEIRSCLQSGKVFIEVQSKFLNDTITKFCTENLSTLQWQLFHHHLSPIISQSFKVANLPNVAIFGNMKKKVLLDGGT